VANELVVEAIEDGCTVVVFEDLTDIRDRMPNARRFHGWAFRRLYGCVSYKAEERGTHVEQVFSKNTSRQCSSCGFSYGDNGQLQDTSCCQSCGYENHADYNAAKNIGYRLLRSQTEGEGGAPVGVRLNTGILNTNGSNPCRIWPERESMVKAHRETERKPKTTRRISFSRERAAAERNYGERRSDGHSRHRTALAPHYSILYCSQSTTRLQSAGGVCSRSTTADTAGWST